MVKRVKQTQKRVAGWLSRLLSSRYFFDAILFVFVLSAGWIAISSRFPMAFDEATHLKTIEYYASHGWPFGNHQPSDLNQYGPIIHNPSYLYHYLMSWPWRVVTAITSNEMAQIITLRMMNIGLVVGAIMLFHRLLDRLKVPRSFNHLVLLFFVLTPLVPLLAAQINYDNLILPLTALSLILAVDIITAWRRRKPWPGMKLVWLIVVTLLACLVKFTFLPIALAIWASLLWRLPVDGVQKAHDGWARWRHKPMVLWQEVVKALKALGRWRRWLMIGLLVLSFGLFLERYAGNVVRYHSPIPGCRKTLSHEACMEWPVYKRNQDFYNTKPAKLVNPLDFTYFWVRHMGGNLMFALNGPDSGYKIGQPLLLPKITAVLLGLTCLSLIAIFWRRLWARPVARLFMIVILFYSLTLWVRNYLGYRHLGYYVAIQGRYLVPILILGYALGGLALSYALEKRPRVLAAVVSLGVIGFMAGGGALTYLLRSDPSWYTPDNSTIIEINNTAKDILKPVIIEGQE